MRLLLFVLLSAAGFAQDNGLRKLEAEMERVSRISGGKVGATAIHIESGLTANLNATDHYPMASTYKVPIAVKLLEKVDAGEERLDRMVTIESRDLHPGSGTLSALFNKPGVALSVRNLLELMLLISDNTATDVLMRLAGGPEAVTAKMKALGLEGIRVSRPTALMIADYLGAPDIGPESEWNLDYWPVKFRAVSEASAKAAKDKYPDDPRDSSTPTDMARLLARIHKRELHKQESAELLVDILKRCQTGAARIKGILPEGTVVAHKTGTVGTTTNDVGIVTLPANAGHVALAVFVKASEKPAAERERAIAEIARAVHDYFLFQ